VLTCVFGTTSTCVGACGWMSRNASTSSVSRTTSGAISPRTILQNRQSFMSLASLAEIETATERVRQCARVHVFEFTAERHAVCDACDSQAMVTREFTDVVRCGFAFHRGIGREYHLANVTATETFFEPIQTKLLGTDTVERRQPP